MNQFKIQLLAFINSKNNQLTWYQIDRAFSLNGIERPENLMQAINYLETEGFITSIVALNISQPTYGITAKGIAALKKATD